MIGIAVPLDTFAQTLPGGHALVPGIATPAIVLLG
jgi:hypothetical protein